MQRQFVTYEIALTLKELGFNEECLGFYKISLGNNTPELIIIKCNYNSGKYITIPEDFYIDAPLWQQCLDWLRERHDIHIVITVNPYSEIKEVNGYKIYTNINSTLVCVSNQELQTWSYYMAREQAILKAIDIIKKEQK